MQGGLDLAFLRHEPKRPDLVFKLVASTRGVALLPIYATNFLPWSVVSRPIEGVPPTIGLMAAHHRANTSPLLKILLSRMEELIERVSKKH
jgi:LysR family transcriptional regulator, hca operon transcriptional activator